MQNLFLIALLVSCMASAAHAQVYKCIEDGKTVFQGVPCRGAGSAITVAPASGSSPSAPPSVPNAKEAPAGTDSLTKLRANVKYLESENRKREIGYAIRDNSIAMQSLETAIQRDQQAMSGEYAVLRSRKLAANNNLAGATWEQSISTEMQAIAARYQVQMQVNRDRITQLRAENADLQKELADLQRSK